METEEAFRKYMQQTVDRQATSSKSLVMSEEKYDAIRCFLLDPNRKVDAHFRYWVKTRKFMIVDLPSNGLYQVLAVPNERKNQVDDSSQFLRVIHAGNVYDIVRAVHVEKLKHRGYKKVMDYVQRHYFGITRGFIQEFCKMCPICQVNHPHPIVMAPPKISKTFLKDVQIDLISMNDSPDGDYNFVGHFMDHFSKYHVLFPVREESADEVVGLLEERVLAYLGPPSIFYSNNGVDFVEQLIHPLMSRWGQKFINGHFEHPQWAGFDDQWNQMIMQKIATMKQEEKLDDTLQCPWASWLPQIQFSMNCAKQDLMKDTPFGVVFGRNASHAVIPAAEKKLSDSAAS